MTSDHLYSNADSDRAIVDAVGKVSAKHEVSHAQIALAWLRSKPAVVTPLVGASKTTHIDDAVASLTVVLDQDDIEMLEAPYTPRVDTQGITDNAMIDMGHTRPRCGAAATISLGA